MKRIGYCLAAMTLLATTASATPITFSTTGLFSGGLSPSNVFIIVNGTTTLTFNGIPNTQVNTDVGAQFGLFTTSVPAELEGPGVPGNFTLTFTQVSPSGTGSLFGTLSGNVGFDTGVATLTFGAGQTSVVLPGGFVYSVNPVYTIALPATGIGAAAATGATTINGTVTGGSVPDSGSTLILMGSAILGLGALRRRINL